MTPRKFNKRSKRKQTFQHQKGDLRITNEISPGNWTWEWLKIHGNHLVYLGHFYIVRKNPRSRCSRVCCTIHIFHVKTISKSSKSWISSRILQVSSHCPNQWHPPVVHGSLQDGLAPARLVIGGLPPARCLRKSESLLTRASMACWTESGWSQPQIFRENIAGTPYLALALVGKARVFP